MNVQKIVKKVEQGNNNKRKKKNDFCYTEY